MNIYHEMEDDIRKILLKAVHAPSGDNMQPWRFEIQSEKILIFNVPEIDPTLYNFRQRAAFISEGALIENITIIAPSFGYNTEIKYFPNGPVDNNVAMIKLNKNVKIENYLSQFINKRQTNRKQYNGRELLPKEKQSIFDIKPESSAISIRIIDRTNEKEVISDLIANADRLIFENKTIHDFLFSHIRWTKEEELKEKNGLYLKTMELKTPQIIAFKLFRNWKIMNLFNVIGFPKLAVKGNVPLYSNSSAFIIFNIQNDNPATFIELGRYVQQVWLTLTSLGLYAQPLTAVPLLMQRIIAGEDEALEKEQADIIKKSYKGIWDLCNFDSGNISFILRMGEAEKPTASSSRLPPEIVVNN